MFSGLELRTPRCQESTVVGHNQRPRVSGAQPVVGAQGDWSVGGRVWRYSWVMYNRDLTTNGVF